MSNALPNRVSAPSVKPNPRPNTRPAGISRKNTGDAPVTSPPSIRKAAPHAASTPSSAITFASMPPSEISASTTTSNNGSTTRKIHGASVACATPDDEGRRNRNGQVNASTPTTLATTNDTVERGRNRIARVL